MLIQSLSSHLLDTSLDMPILSDSECRLDMDLMKFAQKLVKGVLNNKYKRAAVFNNYQGSLIRQEVEKSLYSQDSFIDSSKEIAKKLFRVMKENELGEQCILITCLFSIKDVQRFAILKVNLKRMITYDLDNNNCNMSVQLIPSSLLINNNIKITEAAIVGLSGANDDFHLTVLDKKAEENDTDSVIIDKFLEASTVIDDAYNTRMFISICYNMGLFVSRNSVKRYELFLDYLRYNITSHEEIDVENFIRNSDLTDEEKEELEDRFSRYDIQGIITLDGKCVSSSFKTRTIKTESGFTIKADFDDTFDFLKYKVIENSDGSCDLVIKNVGYIM